MNDRDGPRGTVEKLWAVLVLTLPGRVALLVAVAEGHLCGNGESATCVVKSKTPLASRRFRCRRLDRRWTTLFEGTVSALKLTIDSSETLEDTLRVVGALYNVTLEVPVNGAKARRSAKKTGTSGSSRPARAAGARPQRRPVSRQPSNRGRGRQARAGTRGHGPVDAAAVRSWARENGYTVADRGRMPAEVLTAYKNTHKSQKV